MSNLQIEIETTELIDELHYEPVSPKYRSVQIANAAIVYSMTAALALLLLTVVSPWWCIAAEAVTATSFVIRPFPTKNVNAGVADLVLQMKEHSGLYN